MERYGLAIGPYPNLCKGYQGLLPRLGGHLSLMGLEINGARPLPSGNDAVLPWVPLVCLFTGVAGIFPFMRWVLNETVFDVRNFFPRCWYLISSLIGLKQPFYQLSYFRLILHVSAAYGTQIPRI